MVIITRIILDLTEKTTGKIDSSQKTSSSFNRNISNRNSRTFDPDIAKIKAIIVKTTTISRKFLKNITETPRF